MKTCLILALSTACSLSFAKDWVEHHPTDRMSGKTSHIAVLQSTNTVRLDDPFGDTTALFFFSNSSGNFGGAIGVMKGIIECSAVIECSIEIKADDKASAFFRAETPSSRFTTARFHDPEKVATYIAGATVILVRVPMFRDGRVIFEFTQDRALPVAQKAPP